MDVPVKISFHPASALLLYCSQKVTVNFQPSWGSMDYPTGWTSAGTAISEQLADSNRCLMPEVESTAWASFEEALESEALSWCTKQQEQNPGSAPPGILHVIPLISPSQHVSSDSTSVTGVKDTPQNQSLFKKPYFVYSQPLHVPMATSINASTSASISGYNTHQP